MTRFQVDAISGDEAGLSFEFTNMGHLTASDVKTASTMREWSSLPETFPDIKDAPDPNLVGLQPM